MPIKIVLNDTIFDLMNRKRWVYCLQETKRDPNNKDRFRVCMVFEDEPGFFPMLGQGEHANPWYWDRAACRAQNEKRGFTEEEAYNIVSSSMAAGRV